MRYGSTRGGENSLTSAEAILKGIADDGGLFLPDEFPVISVSDIEKMTAMNYRQRAEFILSKYLVDFTDEELSKCVNGAYSFGKFDTPAIAPVKKLNTELSVLELWHGPTSAFKDMALQILPYFLVTSVEKTGEKNEILILVATSGDTGKAALEGFKDVKGTHVIVFYPEKGVSEVQRMQMCTQEGDNVEVIAVDGNFDDAQSGVKKIFNDIVMAEKLEKKGISLSSANSINWGRLVPQIVYYFSGYCDMVAQASIKLGEEINVVVPTGNFGNILAGYFAKKMGLPIKKFICASNKNNVLTDFINTGKYSRKRTFYRTNSPSMDILISSNLERLLYLLTDKNTYKVNEWMKELVEDSKYSVDSETLAKLQAEFYGEFCDEDETVAEIKKVYEKYNYVVDTHTAVGLNVYEKYVEKTQDTTKTLVLSTANPFKFNESVCEGVFGKQAIANKTEFELVEFLSKECNLEVPQGLQSLDKKEIKFKKVVPVESMGKAVLDSI